MNSIKKALSSHSLRRKSSSKHSKRHEAEAAAAGAGAAAAANSPSSSNYATSPSVASAIVPEGLATTGYAQQSTPVAAAAAEPLLGGFDSAASPASTTAYISETVTAVEVPANLEAQNVTAEPTVVETVFKKEVVHETQKTVEEEIISPTVSRDSEQTRIHQIVQPVLDKVVSPTTYSEQVDVAENRVFREEMSEEVRALYDANAAVSNQFSVAPTEKRTIMQPTTVKERVHSRVVEEITPVIERVVISPVVVSRIKPVFERVIHAPTVTSEIRAPILASELATLTSRAVATAAEPVAVNTTTTASKAANLAGAYPTGNTANVLREE